MQGDSEYAFEKELPYAGRSDESSCWLSEFFSSKRRMDIYAIARGHLPTRRDARGQEFSPTT
jgi:hypothetical protein